jgi:hypothetical protein
MFESMERPHFLLVFLLISSVAHATSDVRSLLDSLRMGTNVNSRTEVISQLSSVKRIKGAIANETTTVENRIDLAFILFTIDKDKTHWAKLLIKMLPESSGIVCADINRLYHVLEVLSNYYILSKDVAAIDFIVMYDSWSDGGPAALFGPVYHKILLKKPYDFLRCIHKRHNKWMDQVLCGILIESRQDTVIIQRTLQQLHDKGLMTENVVNAKIRFMRQYEQ